MKAGKGDRGGRGSDGGGRGGGRSASGGDVLLSSTEKKLVGVYADTRSPGRWHTRFSINGKNKHLCTFGTREEAARAHDRMVMWCELHEEPRGGGLKLNFPRGDYEREREDIISVPTRDAMVTKFRQKAECAGAASVTQSSTWRGVCIVESTGRWRAQCYLDSKKTYLCSFGTPEEAARTYDRMMMWCELHEEPRRGGLKLNFPRGDYEREREDIIAVPTRDAMVTKLRQKAECAGAASVTQSSTWRGVRIVESTGRWRAQCYLDSKITYLGTFDTLEEAARTNDRMMLWRELHENPKRGALKLNFPRGDYECELKNLKGCTKEAMVISTRQQAREQKGKQANTVVEEGSDGYSKKREGRKRKASSARACDDKNVGVANDGHDDSHSDDGDDDGDDDDEDGGGSNEGSDADDDYDINGDDNSNGGGSGIESDGDIGSGREAPDDGAQVPGPTTPFDAITLRETFVFTGSTTEHDDALAAAAKSAVTALPAHKEHLVLGAASDMDASNTVVANAFEKEAAGAKVGSSQPWYTLTHICIKNERVWFQIASRH
jgi:hypothetical protein